MSLLAIEVAALLDVQLDVRGHAPGVRFTDASFDRSPFRNVTHVDRLAAVRLEEQIVRGQLADKRAAPDRAAFLVLEDDHLQRVPGHKVVRCQRPRDLDRAERPTSPS